MKKNYTYLMLGVLVLMASCQSTSKQTNNTDSTSTIDSLHQESSNNETTSESGKPYNETLTFKDISYTVSSPNTISDNQVTITPTGLKAVNDAITIPVSGIVYQAEIDDLNFDGFMDLAIYSRNAGTDSVGNAIVYASNNGKSLSQATVPEIKDDAASSKGWAGHDKFALVEGNFVHNFPIYKDGKPTGKIRQLQYKMVDGETSRVLKLDKTIEF